MKPDLKQSPYLFLLQSVAPDTFQQVTQAGNECVFLHPGDGGLPVTQLHGLLTHLLYQHTLGLGRVIMPAFRYCSVQCQSLIM